MFEKKVREPEKKVSKKVVNKERKEKKQDGKSFAIKSLVIPFVSAAIVVCLIYMVMQSKERTAIVRTDVVTAKVNIAANELITKDNVSDYFEVVSVEASQVADNTYKSMKDLPEKFYTDEAMNSKQIVYSGAINTEDAVMDKYMDGSKKTSFAVSAFDNSVAGKVRHGDVVDVYAIDPSTDELALMLENVYVVASYDSAGEEITDIGTAVTFTVLVAPGETEAMNKAIAYDGIQLYLSK